MTVAILPFLAFAAAQIGTPGPANMALVASGASFGMRRSLPFIGGVVLGKQIVIWPLGLGLLSLADRAPLVLAAMKWISLAVVLWIAWRIAASRLRPSTSGRRPFSFWLGLLVHPFNPKAWAMITVAFTTFVTPGTPALQATAIIAVCFLATQIILHPVWTFAGDRVARTVAGSPAERGLMIFLALLTVLSVAFVLFRGGIT